MELRDFTSIKMSSVQSYEQSIFAENFMNFALFLELGCILGQKTRFSPWRQYPGLPNQCIALTSKLKVSPFYAMFVDHFES